MQTNSFRAFFIIFIISVVIRGALFYSHFSNTKANISKYFGSTAIGFYYEFELSYNEEEFSKLKTLPNNYSGNYLEFYNSSDRLLSSQFLPGPSILLAALWHILPIYNYAPYIWLQIILDSLLIALFYIFFRKFSPKIILLTTAFMLVNLPIIKRVLMMGYDFWPQFIVLLSVILLYSILNKKDNSKELILLGIASALVIWFRSITTFLPFIIALFLFIFYKFGQRQNYKFIYGKIALYFIPFFISFIILVLFRIEMSGSAAPTRTLFWTPFFTGIVQFSDPYDLEPEDRAIYEWAKNKYPELTNFNLQEAHSDINSPLEDIMKTESIKFISNHPFIFVRNIFYRVGVMFSPFLYGKNSFIPERISNILFPIGFPLLLFWFLGMAYLLKNNKILFWITVVIYSYFIILFSWFYLVPRILFTFLFLSILLYLFGLKYLLTSLNPKFRLLD
jgi:hypothetical protein